MGSIRRHARALVAASCVGVLLLAAPAEARSEATGGTRSPDEPTAAAAGVTEQEAGGPAQSRGRGPDKAPGRDSHPHGGPPGRSEAPGRTPTVVDPDGPGERPPGRVPPPAAGPDALPVPPAQPGRPAGASDGPATPMLEVPEPVVEPQAAPPPQAPPTVREEPAPVAIDAGAPTPAPPEPASDVPPAVEPAPPTRVPNVTIRPLLPFGLADELGDLVEGVGQTLDRVVPRDLGPVREPLAELVPVLLAILGAFLALQRGIGHGLGHVPMVANTVHRHTVNRD